MPRPIIYKAMIVLQEFVASILTGEEEETLLSDSLSAILHETYMIFFFQELVASILTGEEEETFLSDSLRDLKNHRNKQKNHKRKHGGKVGFIVKTNYTGLYNISCSVHMYTGLYKTSWPCSTHVHRLIQYILAVHMYAGLYKKSCSTHVHRVIHTSCSTHVHRVTQNILQYTCTQIYTIHLIVPMYTVFYIIQYTWHLAVQLIV